jgi:hypothetical protein
MDFTSNLEVTKLVPTEAVVTHAIWVTQNGTSLETTQEKTHNITITVVSTIEIGTTPTPESGPTSPMGAPLSTPLPSIDSGGREILDKNTQIFIGVVVPVVVAIIGGLFLCFNKCCFCGCK